MTEDQYADLGGETGDDSAVELAGRAGMPSLRFDPTEYEHYVQHYDLTGAQQRELLEAIWAVMVGFVDIGFGLHPVQQASDSGSDPSARDLADDSEAMLASFHIKSEFNKHNHLRTTISRSPQQRNDP